VFVGIGRADGSYAFVSFSRRLVHRPDGKRLPFYNYVFAFGAVVVKVYGAINPPRSFRFLDCGTVVSTIWPVREAFARWLPGGALDFEGVRDLFEWRPFATAAVARIVAHDSE
jgi:hypothetical protein